MKEQPSKCKHLCGVCKVGEKGQIVIPKNIRQMFDINAGDTIVVLADPKKGMALLKADTFTAFTNEIIGASDNRDE